MNLLNSFAIRFVFVNCLLINANSQYRVKGGSDWEIDFSPYMVSINYTRHYRCAGALITMSKVLTSLACLEDFAASDITVSAGKSDIRRVKAFRVAKKIIRPSDFGMRGIDLAVIIVCYPFSKSTKIKPISLCHTTLNPGVRLRVSGWGSKYTSVMQPWPLLQSAVFQVFPINECARRYARAGQSLLSTVICVGPVQEGDDTCWGDAGAPAVVNEKLCAVLSGGIHPIFNSFYPTLYTNMNDLYVKHFIELTRQTEFTLG